MSSFISVDSFSFRLLFGYNFEFSKCYVLGYAECECSIIMGCQRLCHLRVQEGMDLTIFFSPLHLYLPHYFCDISHTYILSIIHKITKWFCSRSKTKSILKVMVFTNVSSKFFGKVYTLQKYPTGHFARVEHMYNQVLCIIKLRTMY